MGEPDYCFDCGAELPNGHAGACENRHESDTPNSRRRYDDGSRLAGIAWVLIGLTVLIVYGTFAWWVIA